MHPVRDFIPENRIYMNKFSAILLTSLLLILPQTFSVQAAQGAKDGDLVRTELYASDYHVEARRVLKTIRKAIEKVQALQLKAKRIDLVVLENSLQKNVKSLKGLEEIAEEIYGKMSDAVALKEHPPTEAERKAGDEFLRQLNVVKDRAIALYVTSRSFTRKLLRKTGTRITRIGDQ